jgi:hypothetical protein
MVEKKRSTSHMLDYVCKYSISNTLFVSTKIKLGKFKTINQ